MSKSMHKEIEIDPEYKNIEADINEINLQLTKQNNSNSPIEFKKIKKDGIIRSHDGDLGQEKVSDEKSSDNDSDNTANNKKDPNDPSAEKSEKK